MGMWSTVTSGNFYAQNIFFREISWRYLIFLTWKKIQEKSCLDVSKVIFGLG